jgi:bifunctional UDP-N-acetylglucosamine pyrophosphorylase/glucosamine-1-phosphate N-acetyltransferase
MQLKHSGIAGIVMAAGKGARFASAIPKVMQIVGGTPILKHVVDTGMESGLNPLVVVIRPDLEIGLAGEGAIMVDQPPGESGTAYATEIGLSKIPSSIKTVAVLYGDSPLLEASTVNNVVKALTETDAVASLSWARVPNPGSFGRIVIDTSGIVRRVIEASEATPEELLITTVNAGPCAFRADWLRDHLASVKPSPISGERYLTDLFGIAIKEGSVVKGHEITDLDETIGCDDLERLKAANLAYDRRNE